MKESKWFSSVPNSEDDNGVNNGSEGDTIEEEKDDDGNEDNDHANEYR